jgi:hypothetical protein
MQSKSVIALQKTRRNSKLCKPLGVLNIRRNPQEYEDLNITVDLLSKCPYKERAGFQAASELVLS